MQRRNSLLKTALLAAPFVLAGACEPTVDVGSMATCSDGLICDLDGGFSDAALPIGDAQFGDFDRAAIDGILAGMAGDWHGIAAGVETISQPFEMHFSPASAGAKGQFSLHCLERGICIPLGAFNAGNSSGDYQLTYVDGESAGQGEFTWEDGINGLRNSVKFRNLLLQRSGQVLFFVIDIPLFAGTSQVIMQRGLWQDAGTGPSQVAPPEAPDGGAP